MPQPPLRDPARPGPPAPCTGGDFLQAPGWRPARWGVLLLLLANVMGLNAWAYKERSAQQSRRAAIGQTLTQTFPAVRVVVDAPLQMQRQFDLLRRAGELRLKGLATEGSESASISKLLTALGYSSRIEGNALLVRQDSRKEGQP